MALELPSTYTKIDVTRRHKDVPKKDVTKEKKEFLKNYFSENTSLLAYKELGVDRVVND